MYKYNPGLEESYCSKPFWYTEWRWGVYLKVEKPQSPYLGRFIGENFKGDPEDADYVWVPRGSADMCDSETYEKALAYLREKIIAPRIEMKRLDNVIIHAPFPEHLPE